MRAFCHPSYTGKHHVLTLLIATHIPHSGFKNHYCDFLKLVHNRNGHMTVLRFPPLDKPGSYCAVLSSCHCPPAGKKESTMKWTPVVQIHVAQGSAVFSHGWQVFYTLMLNAEVAERGGQL